MAIESSTVDNAKTVDVVNQPILQTATYGGTGGSPYTYSLGSYITKLATYTNGSPSYLWGLQLTFDSGEVVTFGTNPGNGSSLWNTLDLTNDSIAKLYILTIESDDFGSGTGVGGIYIETLRGQAFASNSTYKPSSYYSSGWYLVTSTSNEPCQNIFLVGVKVLSGSGIDNLAFLYKEDALMTRVTSDFAYQNWVTTPDTPINVASAIVDNQTEQMQQMSIAFQTTVSSSYTWNVSAGIKIGVSTTFETGIPYVAKGEVSVSTEISFNASYGQTHSVSEAFSYSAAVSVPAGATIQANATASSYQISGSYTANYTENWAHAGAVSRQISGTIEGLSAYNVVVDYVDATPQSNVAAAQTGD